MHRFVYTCPFSGLAIMVPNYADDRSLRSIGRMPIAVTCAACGMEHSTTYADCKSYRVASDQDWTLKAS